MHKYYRVKKDNFMWKEGAIIHCEKFSNGTEGYKAIEDIWNSSPALSENEYISLQIIECPSNSEFFERVYPDTIAGKYFKTKDQLVEMYKTSFSGRAD